MIQQSESGWVPRPTGASEVLAQLNRILGSILSLGTAGGTRTSFGMWSKRRFGGAGDQLRRAEYRDIIFDRPPDYDTNSDSIVRVTAAEILAAVTPVLRPARARRRIEN